MNNYVNYFNHILIQPSEIKLRFDRAFALSGLNTSEVQSRALSISQLALPLFCLYKPIGTTATLLAGGGRVFCHLSNTILALKEGKWSESGTEMLHTSLAVFLLCSTYFEFKIGLFLNNGYDAVLGIYHITQHITAKEYSKAGEEMLQLLSTVLYMGLMLTGELEYLLAMMLVQGALSLYQATKELSEKHYPEAIAHFAMACVRLNQSYDCYEQIVARNLLLSMERCQALFDRVLRGKETKHLLESDLLEFSNVIEISNGETDLPGQLLDIEGNLEKYRVVIKGAGNTEYDFGAHFHAYGKALVKGANIEFRKVTLNNETFYELDFKVNSFFRKGIEGVVNDFKKLNQEQIQAVLKASHSKAEGIVVKNGVFPVGNQTIGPSHEINVEGLGKVMIGASTEYLGLYNRVIVRIDKSKNIFDLHDLLALTGLETALKQSNISDMERLKIGHLYRVFFPKAATSFERTQEFFNLPIDDLKKVIITKTPGMKDILNTHLNHLEKWEMLPGKVRYKITGLASKLRANGARFLTSALTGVYNEADYFSRVESILKMGLVSNDTRTTHGLNAKGLSSTTDFRKGGADSVFTQLITDKMASKKKKFGYLYYDASVRVIISLDAIETGTYQYHDDSFGTRNPEAATYQNRPGILEFVQSQNKNPTADHEVMIKDRIPPSLIKGLIVKSQAMKTKLIDHLRKAKLVEKSSTGVETLLGVPVNQFVQCAAKMSEVKV